MRLSATALLLVLAPIAAEASPYRLRGDAFVQAQEPTGALILDGQGEVTKELGVEVFVWGGVGGVPNPEADLLVAALRYRDPEGRAEVRAGRIVLAAGALRPLHMDGVTAFGRAPWGGTALQAFTGITVAPRFSERGWDWLVGGRLSQQIGIGVVGVAYLQQRDHGQIADHEVALDLTMYPVSWLDLALRGAYDLAHPGLSEAILTAAAQAGDLRLEIKGVQRSPTRLLPATSLFTVLGDLAFRSAAGQARWRVAPRLDLVAGAGARFFDEDAYEDVTGQVLLRLGDHADDGQIGVEVRRQGAPEGGWLGARLTARVPINGALFASSEIELVRPDEPRARGELWPWALLGISWYVVPSWEMAIAAEGNMSPEAKSSFDVLVRLAYLWSDT
ncbi:MAG: hypothetical protein IT384_15130 [Deltaproteobacteria bacterium]|nr:hypothetical protein [Deltaproteobacteria bacterium]